MSLVKKEFLFQQMRSKELTNWKVLAGGKLMMDDECNTVDEAISSLRRCLKNIYDGIVEVKLSKYKDDDKGNGGKAIREGNYTFKVEIDGGEVKAANESRVSGIDATMMEQFQAMSRELEEYKRKEAMKPFEDKIAALELKIGELSNDDNEPTTWQEKAIQGFMENPQEAIASVMQIISMLKGGGVQPMAGIGSVQVQDTNQTIQEHDTVVSDTAKLVEQQKEKCRQALSVLLTVDANAGDHLLMLAELAQRDPNTYAYALQLLNTQLENIRKKDGTKEKKQTAGSVSGDRVGVPRNARQREGHTSEPAATATEA